MRIRIARLVPASLLLVAVAAPVLVQAEPAPTPAAPSKVVVKVDVNTAGQAELETLPRVGPALAQRILEYRKQVGTIKSVDELVNVKGIGEKLLDSLRPYLTVSGSGQAPAPKKP